MRAAIYARVSTTDQNGELQLRELRAYADRQGWLIVETYQDIMSGAKANRPGLNRLMLDARARKFDCLLVWKLDRFGRSLVDCLNNIKTLEDNDVRFIAVTQGLDTDQRNPASRFLLHVLGTAGGIRKGPDSGAHPSRPAAVPAGLCRWQGQENSLQPIRKEPPAPPPKEDL